MSSHRRTFTPRVLHDERTGREVIQITPDGHANVSNYFYMNSFSPDERYLYYASYADGAPQVHRVEIATGEITRITDAAHGIHLRWNQHPCGREIFYVDDRMIKAVDLASGATRTVFDASEHEWMKGSAPEGLIRFCGDGTWLCFHFVHDPQECIAPNMWSHHGLVKYQRMGVARVACDGSKAQCVYLHHEAMQHLMFSPTNSDLMNFAVWPDYQNNEKLLDSQRARVWQIDLQAGCAYPFLIMPKGYRATHEYWSPDASKLFYHKRAVDDIWSPPRNFPTFLGYLDTATGQQVDFLASQTQAFGHSICTHDGRFVITDNDLWAAKDFKGVENELILVEVATGKSEVLWWPNVRGEHPKMACSGPCLSPKATWVGRTSDRSGEPQIYLTRLPDYARSQS